MNRNKLFSILILIGMVLVGYLFYQFKYVPYRNAIIVEQEVKEQEAIEEANAPKLVKQELEKLELTNSQKIDELRDKKNNYKVIQLSNYSKVYFKESDNSLDLYLAEDKIGNFDLVDSNELIVELIEGTNSDLFIKVGTDKFYYNNSNNEISKIDLKVEIKYVKTGSDESLLFVTDKGTFVYNIFSQEFDFFSYFTDFVYFDDGYLGIVKIDDERIRTNLGYSDERKHLIVYYNPQTKEKKIVHRTDESVKKIYKYNTDVIIINNIDEIFKIENL